MTVLLIIIHIVVCIALIMIVLLQTGKGADMGAAFGGGSSQTLFGSTGASTFLSKATTGAAIVFMVTSLGLAYLSTHRIGGESVVTSPSAPVQTPAPPAPGTAPATEDSGSQPAPQSESTQQSQPAEQSQPAQQSE
jgi:preprotein translocase subunit SecG